MPVPVFSTVICTAHRMNRHFGIINILCEVFLFLFVVLFMKRRYFVHLWFVLIVGDLFVLYSLVV